jgi:short-subunit dehydrogenase
MLNRKGGHMVFMSSLAGKAPAAGNTIYNATKFGIRGFALALREELIDTRVGVSVICPTFVREAGMWAETGLKASSAVGEVSPEEVADAVWYAITRNRAEIDVMPFQVRAGLKVQALAPGLFTAIARAQQALSGQANAWRQTCGIRDHEPRVWCQTCGMSGTFDRAPRDNR